MLKRWAYFLSFLVLLWICRGVVFRLFVHYDAIQERNFNTHIEDHATRDVLDNWLMIHKKSTFETKIDFAQAFVADRLSFSSRNASNDPNTALHTGKANCIGYASACRMVLCYLLRQDTAHYQCTQQVGKLHFWGYDVHKWLDYPMFRDHDFIILRDASGENVIAFDPSVYDYTGISEVRSHR